jgi:hypothetical protein
VSSVALAVGVGFLNVKHVELPPSPSVERARMLALEPERYFADGAEPMVTALDADTNLAFAAPEELVAQWLAAFEEWGPVSRIEPAPLAAARILGRNASGDYQLDAADGETGRLAIRDGSVTAVRRIRGSGDEGARPLPEVDRLSGRFAAAVGVARAADDPPDAVLAPAEWIERITARHRNRLRVAIAAAAGAFLFALWAADRWRERTLEVLDERTAQVADSARPAEDAMRSLLSREAEAVTIRTLAVARPDPYGALAALGVVLPRDAIVLAARATGDDWQIDGTAGDASALVPLLDRDGRFDNVRFLSASSRYREGNRTYETFSIALRYRPRP